MDPRGPTLQARLHIGAWDVLPELNELRRDGHVVRIEPKAMELLQVLARRAPQVVGRAELLQAVWPGVVVGDEALTQAVTKLRRALGDTARPPVYIETIAKRGYRLIATVSHTDAAAAGPMDRPPDDAIAIPEAASPPTGRQRRRVIAGASALVVAAALALWGVSTPRPEPVDPGDDPLPARSREDPLPTIAVAEFERLGGDAVHDYLARGITADLVHDLATLGSLAVVDAGASGVAPGAADAAPFRVSGTLQVAAGELRLNVRLVEMPGGRVLWSQRYERQAGDLLAVQKDIVARLLQALPIEVDEAQRLRMARRHTHSDRAYDLFLRGRSLLASRDGADTARARALFLQAIELDPRFARAYASLAMTHAYEYRYGGAAAGAQSLTRARQLATTARDIDPALPESYWVLGFVSAMERRHREARRHLQEALALNPSYADAHALLGAVLIFVGEPAAALRSLRAALRFVPDGRAYIHELIGRAHFFLGDLEQALINLREAVARNTAVVDAQVFLAATLAASGADDEARWVALQIRALDPAFSIEAWVEGYPTTVDAHRSRLISLLAPLELSARPGAR